MTARGNLHQTLLFLGDVDAARAAEVASWTREVAADAYHLDFGACGYWRHNRIVWIAPRLSQRKAPPALGQLVAALSTRARSAGFKIEKRAYVPHVTLLRDANPPAEDHVIDCRWAVNDFVLVSSSLNRTGVRYEVIARSGAAV